MFKHASAICPLKCALEHCASMIALRDDMVLAIDRVIYSCIGYFTTSVPGYPSWPRNTRFEMCPKEALVQKVREVFCDNVRCKDGPYTKALGQTDYGMCVARYDFFRGYRFGLTLRSVSNYIADMGRCPVLIRAP